MLRPFTLLASFGFLSILLTRPSLAAPSPPLNFDPCKTISGKTWVDPADVLTCMKSFSFNDTLRQNVLSVVSGVLDFYTFEIFYSNPPSPFQDSTTDIRGQIQRIGSTQYDTDYDFELDLYNLLTRMNDGHTRWYPDCYLTYNNILPTPVVLQGDDVFIAPDSVELFEPFGPGFTRYFDEKNFDWKRLAGSQVLEIGGLPALQYIDNIAKNVSGNYLDHNIRVNSVVSSYRISGSSWSQRLGDLASEAFLQQTSLTFKVLPPNSNPDATETVDVPFIAGITGNAFTDGPSYWANNCVATNTTNGAKRVPKDEASGPLLTLAALRHPNEAEQSAALALPPRNAPTLEATGGSSGPVKSYILPGNKTGVMFVGSFAGDFIQTQVDMALAIQEFLDSGVTNLVIDVTNNGGGYVCVGLFLYQYLTGATSGPPGFESSSRANPLAQKILGTIIAQQIPAGTTYYASSNWLFLNGTKMPEDYNYNDPSTTYDINEQDQRTSQRFRDRCPHPPKGVRIPSTAPFDLSNVVIVGNGNCASTCGLFTTLMYELHGTKIATFGGHKDQPMEYKGMAGNQVLEWRDLDSELKTVGLKDDPLAPPDLLVQGNMRHNFRTAYSYANLNLPIAYVTEPSQYRYPYSVDTYNNPQNVWTFIAKEFFGDNGQ